MMLMSMKQVSAYLGVHSSTVYRWLQQGAFVKPVHVGPAKRPRWEPTAVESWVKAHNMTPNVGNNAGNGEDSKN